MGHFKETKFGFINIIFDPYRVEKDPNKFFHILGGGTNIGSY